MAEATNTGRRLAADIAALLADGSLKSNLAKYERVPASQLSWYNAETLQTVWLLLDEAERVIWRGRHLQPRGEHRIPFEELAERLSMEESKVQDIHDGLEWKIFILAWSVGHHFAGLPISVLRHLWLEGIQAPFNLPRGINKVVGSRGFGLKRFKDLEAWWNLKPGRTNLADYLSADSRRKLGLPVKADA